MSVFCGARGRGRLLAWLAVGLLHSLPLAAQTTPGAGTLLQDLRPMLPPEFSPSIPRLTLEPQEDATLPPTAPFAVAQLRLSGNTSYDTATLHALVADAEGGELTLAELDARVARITEFYRAHGYPFARALIPAQSIRDGIVDVAIIEARYGQILLENQSRVRSSVLESTLAPLQPGRLIEQSMLEHTLLLLADIPGATPAATLRPGAAYGSSDLLVQTAATPSMAGLVTLDNEGNRYTGRTRASGDVTLYDPLHFGDAVEGSVLTSGKGLEYGRLSYDSWVDERGTHVGAAYSALHYVLGNSLTPLDGHGTAQVASAWLRHPFVRSRAWNLYAELQFNRKTLHDRLDVNAMRTDRHLNDWTASLTGDGRDAWLSGGATSWSVQWLQGHVEFDDERARLADASTARTAGSFRQWNASVARLQRLDERDSLSVVVSGQGAGGNLDASQKLVAGGRYTVRAYDTSAASGDTGEQGSVEVRHDLAGGWHGQWQTSAFVDIEHVTVNKNPWTIGRNDATLRGTGLALAWAGRARCSAKAHVAWRLGEAPALVGNASRVRAWVELNKGF